MSPWKNLTLTTYYSASLPWRMWRMRQLCEAGRAPLMAIFYHRVADEHPNDWTISNREFARQIDWLRKHFDLISLYETQRRLRIGRNHRPSVAITFDDGYADNCEFAIPLLVRHRIPCTYFVASRNVIDNRPFPHDLKSGQPLAVNTIEQIRALAAAGVEIGAHTRTHPDLGRIKCESRMKEEIADSGKELADLIGKTIRYFAFPYGLPKNLSPDAFRVACEAGYEGVVTAYGGYNFPGEDDFHIQRIHADPEFIRLRNWLTYDPRKAATVRRYEYSCPTRRSARELVEAV
jgi:peptidoglycan/xylan/chitin deacetylase (PgdA/CDA1 family)